MYAWHQKKLLEPDFPFRLWVSENMDFRAHWHEEIEVVYMLSGTMQVGLNNEVYTLQPKDILLIGSGDVHYFIPQHQWGKKVLFQFGLSLFDTHSESMSDRKFVRPLLTHSRKLADDMDIDVHRQLEEQILLLMDEYQAKQECYRLALKARLYDLMVILLRHVHTEKFSQEQKSKQLMRLERLEKVFQYVEEHYNREINLEEVSESANYSVYHFTRFFKDTTGMTFGQYLSNFRIRKAELLLWDKGNTITDVAFEAGFNSIKTFNRVFKQLIGCSPTAYRKKAIFEK